MGEESLAQVGLALVSLLALLLSLFNLYLQRRDRRPRLEIRARYEYRVETSDGASGADALPQIHDDSQEGLYLLLGDFLREHGFGYLQGTPLVRFALCPTRGPRPSTWTTSVWSSATAVAYSGTG